MLRIYSVYDRKGAYYSSPMFLKSEADAVRGLQVSVNDPKMQLSMFSDDFDLYEFGNFDEMSGVFVLFDKPKFIIAASSFKKVVENAEK